MFVNSCQSAIAYRQSMVLGIFPQRMLRRSLRINRRVHKLRTDKMVKESSFNKNEGKFLDFNHFKSVHTIACFAKRETIIVVVNLHFCLCCL